MTTSRKPRRFLPEPIETSSRSSKKYQDNEHAKQYVHSRQTEFRISELNPISSTNVPFGSSNTPQPWQTGRQPESMGNNEVQGSTALEITPPTQKMEGNQRQNPRRFTPQLMETARHSFRPGKKAVTPNSSAGPQIRSLSDANEALDRVEAHESQFSYSSLLRRQETRRHSFRVPDLPAIPSSGSEECNEPNSPELLSPPFATSCGTGPRSDDRKYLKDAEETPFSYHPSENQLREQALAAFPNEQVYQPVDHFAIDRDDEESPYEEEFDTHGPSLEFRISRRASSADLPSELEYLRRHKEEAGMNRRHYYTTRGRFPHVTRQTFKSADKAVNHDDARGIYRPLTRPGQTASPPMLGADLAFPQSLTPENTICEGTHTTGSKGGRPNSSLLAGLWNASSPSSAEYDRGGLWNGTCKSDWHNTHRTETLLPGLTTPRHGVDENDLEHPYKLPQTEGPHHYNSHFATQSPRYALGHSENTNQEFNDAFVTQIYDYLSLGYPSVGRYYDYELSKVSGLPVAALREDDLNMDAKGHVGVHITNTGAANVVCMRWTALRLYIKEWARQHPQMLEAGHHHETWGVRERKGSWAV
ncbi:hypothetical protein BDW62DRAFT_38280 [Aspergillus aurantiobrunneus]